MTDLILKDLGVLTTMATQILKKTFLFQYEEKTPTDVGVQDVKAFG